MIYTINKIKSILRKKYMYFVKKSISLKFNHFDFNVSRLSNISSDEMYENQAPIVRTLFNYLIQRSQEDKSIENRQKRKFRKC